MAISKKIREEVYRKYDGHCAYCGREIAYKDMQVDHFLPRRAWRIEDAGTDDISNLMPSCRMCNHYKRANTLETFRRYIAEIPRKLRENYIYKVGVVYGNVIENEKAIEFYFEKQKSTTHWKNGAKMAEYINRKAAFDAITDLAGKAPTRSAYEAIWKSARVLKKIPASDVVPTSQERIYKDLLDALFEDVRSLDTTLADECCMCSKGECDDCNLRTFEDELLAILGRASERKKRVTD